MFGPLEIVQIIFAVCTVATLAWLVYHVRRVLRFNRALIAHAKEVVPTKHLIELWKKQYALLPSGSIKARLYEDRLKECGAFDGPCADGD